MAKILVVDDDKDILNFAKALLEHDGHQVMTCLDAVSAIHELKNCEYNLLVTDANMPRFSGFDFLKGLKSDPQYKNLPVALLTARKDVKDVDLAIKLGVNDYIVKPIDPSTFLEKITNLLEHNKAEPVAEFILSEKDPRIKGTVGVDVLLHSINPNGVVLYSRQPLHEHQQIQFQNPVFREIGIQPPRLLVMSWTKNEHITHPYSVEVQFLGLTEVELNRLSAWIMRNVVRQIKNAG